MIELKLKNIKHNYIDKKGENIHAIDGIDLDIQKGEFLAILGASGCGKSTLLNIMSGILEPTEGEVLIRNQPVNYKTQNIGYISQSDTLLPWRKIIDNVALGLEIKGIKKEERYEIAKKLMESGGLSGFEFKYPYELSGGMKKRAIILRALATDPDIIFMDEPFGPLDVFTKELLQQEILKIWNEKELTVVYITHDIEEAIMLADRIILMSYRPSKIKKEYNIDLERPRNIYKLKSDSRFISYRENIWDSIKDEVMKSREEDII